MPKMDSRTLAELLLISRIFKPITRQAASLLLICALGLFASVAFALPLPTFPDPYLRSCFNEQASANGWQLAEDVDELVCVNRSISDLSGLSGLPNLRSVDFSENRISDLYPLTMGSLPGTLRELRLADNRITEIGYLINYEYLTLLDLSGNRSIDFGRLRPIIEQNARLVYLRLRGIRIAPDESLSFVNPVTSQPLPLRELDVSDTGIDRLAGLEIYNWLSVLKASGNGQLDLSALTMGKLPQTLQALYLADVGILDPVSTLRDYHRLRSLDLSGNSHIDFNALRPIIGQNSGLTRLRLRGIRIAPDESLSFVNPATNQPLLLLRELDVSDTGIDSLKGMEIYDRLEILNASGNGQLDVSALTMGSLPQTLRELYLADEEFFDPYFLSAYRNLTVLDLSGNRDLPFRYLGPMIKQNTGLTRLRLRGISIGPLEDLSFINWFGQPLPLVELDVSDTGIDSLAGVETCGNLEILNASGNGQLDISALWGNNSPQNLRELYLAGSAILDPSPLERYHNLTVLDLSGNSHIDFNVLRPMIERNAGLTRLRLRGIRIAPDESLLFLHPFLRRPLPLAELDVSKTGIDRLEGVDAYSGLEILNASGNGQLELSALTMGSLPQTLHELYLADDLFMGPLPLDLYHNLTVLDLSGGRDLSFDELRPMIEQNSGLTRLRLRGIPIGPLGSLSFVNPATNRPLPLVELDVSDTGIARLEGVETYNDLEILNASGNSSLDFSVLTMGNLPQTLRELGLADNGIMGSPPLERYQNLSVLDLSGNTHIDFGSLRPVIEQNAELTRLRLRGIRMAPSENLLFINPSTNQPLPLIELDVSETGVQGLDAVDAYPLEILNASGNAQLDLEYGVYLPPTLRELYLAETGIYNTSPLEVCQNLTVLDLSENSHIHFPSLRRIIEQNPGLGRLRLRGIRMAPDESLSFVFPGNNQPLPLVELDVSETGIDRLDGVDTYSGLEVLNASGNDKLDISALAMGSLPQTLRELYLADNLFMGAYPFDPYHNLTVLDFSGNRYLSFYDLRRLIGQNSGLTRLRLRGISIGPSGGLEFFSQDTYQPLPLVELDVSDTGIKGLWGVESYSRLEVLSASGNDQLDLSALTMGNLPQTLRELYLADTGVLGAPPLANYGQLSVLDLSGNPNIDIRALRPLIEQNAHLQRLKLADIPMYMPDFTPFLDRSTGTPLPLIELDLSRTMLQSVTGIDSYLMLQSLRAEGNDLRDISPLSGLTELRELSLAGNSGIDSAQLQPIIEQNRQLQSLNLADIAIHTPDVALFLGSATGIPLPLRELDLSRTGIQGLTGIEAYSNLRSLRFEGNGVTDVSPLGFLDALRELSLSGNGGIDFAQLQPIIEQNRQLWRLGLADIAINSPEVPTFFNQDTGMPLVLTELDLSRTGLESLMNIGVYEDLQVLAVSGNGLTNIDPLRFFASANMAQLHWLDLSANRLENIFPLLQMRALKQVNLRETTTLPCDQLDQLELQLKFQPEPGSLIRPASCVVGRQPVLTLSEPLEGLVAFEGELVTLSALATDPEDGDLSDLIEWSSNQGVIGTGAPLEYRLLLGDQTITARVTDSDGGSVSASVNITVHPNHAPVVTIVKPFSGLTIIEGTAVELSAEARDVEDGPLSDAVVWSSDIQGDLGPGGNIQATLSVGTHTLNAKVSDSLGKEAVATTAVTVLFNNPPVLSVTSPANGASFIEGETIPFAATATDVEDGDISSNIEWYAQGVLIGMGSSLTPNLAAGVHDMQAKIVDNHGKSALVEFQVTVVFNNPPQLTVESPPQGVVTEQYLPIHLAATAEDVESGDLSSSITWSSDISGSLGTGAELDVTLPVGVHTLTAQVIDPLSSKISAVTRTVTVNASPQFAYCAAGGEHSERAWIEQVDISGTSNTSGNQGGYGDFTVLGPIYLQSGRNHNITLTPGFSSSVFALRWQVWIDLNRDGQFGSDELVLSAKGSRLVSSEFAVPATSVAGQGQTRMRIVMRKDRGTDACSTFSVGEVEDYSVVLLP